MRFIVFCLDPICIMQLALTIVEKNVIAKIICFVFAVYWRFFLLFCSACDFCFGTTVERVFEGSYETLRQNVIARSDSFKTYC